jgi:hypothetical protein
VKKFVFLLLILAAPAWAEDGDESIFKVYGDVGFLGGYSQVEAFTGMMAPLLLQYGGGLTLGIQMKERWILGVATDYRITQQYSDVERKVGNFAGSRWNMAAPVIGMRLGNFIFKAEPEFLGDYKLSHPTRAKETVTYKSPLGGKFTILLPPLFYVVAMSEQDSKPKGPITIGLYGEYLMFRKQVSSSLGEMRPTPSAKFMQAGLTLGYVF